ncbi:Trigger factor, ribosome-binding, bacterial [Dillenia turbinata]|uniref:peptidylprolyl isomerase n=1 Tax=Dillenia turbinata TaxID=194707 RepID=A0AAN8UNH8_9MAGN
MEIAVKTPLFGFKLNSQRNDHSRMAAVFVPDNPSKKTGTSLQMRYSAREFLKRATFSHYMVGYGTYPVVCAVSSGLKEVSPPTFEDFTVTAASANEGKELKIKVDVSGTKTQEIFDDVFSKMVADAQPIPGFRRVKGGKTPNIPIDILLEVLGPSKVYKQVIKKIINWAVADYVHKEGLKVTKDLRVEQSFEELEANFDPGEKLSFDAMLQLLECN